MSIIFDPRSSNAYDRYTQGLHEARKLRDWIYDPSFALASDWDVYQKIMRDATAAHAIRFRKHLTAGAEWRIEPASDSDEDKRAAEIIEEMLDQIHNFTEARIKLSDSIFTGSSYAFMEGEKVTKKLGGGKPRSWWCPYALKDVDRRRFRRFYDIEKDETRWELWSNERGAWEPLENPEWFIHSVYDNTESSLGYGRGLLDSLYQFQACKSRVIQDAMATSERGGQGFLTVGVDSMRGPDGRPVAGVDGSGTTVAQAWATELDKHRARHILVHDARDEVKLVTGFGEGWGLLMQMVDYFDTQMVTAVLGSNLPTGAESGGSYALGIVQENSTEALIQADRIRISDEITRDLVGACWRYNYQELTAEGLKGARMPKFRIVNQKREDPVDAVGTISTLLDAGIALRKDEVYRKAGFTVPLPEDEVIGEESKGPDLSALLTSPMDQDTENSPEQIQPDTAPEPADAALNGAQVTALQGIVQNVAANLLPEEAAIELILAGFPAINRDKAVRMVNSAAKFEPAVQPPDPQATRSRNRNGHSARPGH